MVRPSAPGPRRRNPLLRALGRIVAQAATASVTTSATGPRAARVVPGPVGTGATGASPPAAPAGTSATTGAAAASGAPGAGGTPAAPGTAGTSATPGAAGTPTGARRTGPDRSTRLPRPVRRDLRWSGRRLPVPAMVVLGLMLIIVTSLGYERITGVSVLPSGLTAGLRPPPRKFPVLEASPPISIAIPAIRLDAVVHGVGIAGDGTIAVPGPDRADEAGWYDQSPTPGQYGPAVLVGHVDTRTGPAVFHELHRLRPGERMEVTREDGSVAVFEVNSVKRFDKAQIPVDQVYGDFSRPGLRVITCGGRWVGGETGYADNVVVFASLVTARGP